MAAIYGDAPAFRDRPPSSRCASPGRPAQPQPWADSRARPFATCLPNRQENTAWEVAETHDFKITVNTGSRRNSKGWDTFLTRHFGQKLLLVGYYLLWRLYSQAKMNPGLGDSLALFQKTWERRKWQKTGIPSTSLWPSHGVQSLLTSTASCKGKGSEMLVDVFLSSL